ncbi:Wzz/FepE/Etk N-terminal domain-containing protein [uncultured Trichococcus sp.]|uniref:YveK family protein n=1 Tax=uncultured Trichococcus sp. TaxID=189665 RepID=UPI0029C727AF|nr:Wzz/FepE/Etk N-terminal domain-containing protein [uncultured Trichococcus sp.]
MKEEVSLRDLTALIKQRLGMIIGFGLIGLVLAAIYTFLIVTPQYESKTQLLVNRASDEANGLVLNDINSNVQMINTYKDIIEGPVILGSVIEWLELPYSVEMLADQVTISANEDSQVFSLAVTSSDPDEAAEIANEIALTFQSNVVEIMNIENVQIISSAVPDLEPVSPHVVNNLLIGLGVGLLSGFGVAMLRYAMAKTIDDYQFITQTIGWPNLGTISELNKEEKTAIADMQKQKIAATKGLVESERATAAGTERAVAHKRIPDEKTTVIVEQAQQKVHSDAVKEPKKNKAPKKQHSAHSGMGPERLVTVADMTREKIGVILQNSDGSETMDAGNKRGKR